MRLISLVANLWYPPACPLCRRALSGAEAIVCPQCLAGAQRNGPPACTRCGVELPGAFDAVTRCGTCRKRPPAFETAKAPWQYRGPIQEAVRQFKYHRRWRIGRWLAAQMAVLAESSLPLDEVDVVLGVPPHWLARRLKGCSPVEELARQVSRALRKPYRPGGLRRRRWTTTQTRLSWQGRFRNVSGAFAASRPVVADRGVLLIDDVLTSGATAHACALALKTAGARHVFVVTAARTPLSHHGR